MWDWIYRNNGFQLHVCNFYHRWCLVQEILMSDLKWYNIFFKLSINMFLMLKSVFFHSVSILSTRRSMQDWLVTSPSSLVTSLSCLVTSPSCHSDWYKETTHDLFDLWIHRPSTRISWLVTYDLLVTCVTLIGKNKPTTVRLIYEWRALWINRHTTHLRVTPKKVSTRRNNHRREQLQNTLPLSATIVLDSTCTNIFKEREMRSNILTQVAGYSAVKLDTPELTR